MDDFRFIFDPEMPCLYCGQPMKLAKGFEHGKHLRSNYTCRCEGFNKNDAIDKKVRKLIEKADTLRSNKPEENFEMLYPQSWGGAVLVKKPTFITKDYD